MEDQFIPYELALKLKEIGFDELCLGFYDPTLGKFLILNGHCINPKPTLFNHNSYIVVVSAPLWQQAFDWFREQHNLYYIIADKLEYWVGEKIVGSPTGKSDSYPKARQACLEKLIKIIENEKI